MVVPWICPKCKREVGCVNAGQPMELCAACMVEQDADARVVLLRRYEPAVTLLQEIGALADLAYSELDYDQPLVAHDFLLVVRVLLKVHSERGIVGLDERPAAVMEQAQELWNGVHHRNGTIKI